MKELYINALLTSLDENTSWKDILDFDLSGISDEEQKLIEKAQKAILPNGKQIQTNAQQILSPFSFKKGEKDFFIASSKLIEVKEKKLAPTYYPDTSKGATFQELLKEFKQGLKKLQNEEQLLALMRQYFSLVSADNTGVSLYDYARLTAAIACCLQLNEDEGKADAGLLFIKGDVSGIQDFIFNITSKKAAKSLKTRSFRVQVLAKLAIQYILKEFGLPKANLLYDGGGNFYLFAPASKAHKIADLKEYDNVKADNHLKKYFAEQLLDDDLQIHLGYTHVELPDLRNFSEKWKEVARNMGRDKLQLFKPLDRDEIFTPLPIENLTVKRDAEAEKYAKISAKLNKVKGFEISPNQSDSPYSKFGYTFNLQKKSKLSPESTVFNSFNENQSDFTFAVTKMPVWTKELIEANQEVLKEAIEEDIRQTEAINKKRKSNEPKKKRDFHRNVHKPKDLEDKIIEFHWLAHFAYERTGTKKLGVVKMDIDGLGNMFKDGLKKNQNTVLHVAALSRALKWFFEGYMNTLLDKPIDKATKEENPETYRHNIYVLFSGGDDFFLVGAWDKVLEFASIVREEFVKFNSKTLTISAGYVLTDPKFPVTRFAMLADEAESDAKSYNQKYMPKENIEDAKVKDKMAIFGQVISWTEMEEAEKLRDQLYHLVTKEENREPRSVINKIQRSMYGYHNIHKKMLRGSGIPIPRLWRLNQFLRTIKKSNRAEAQSIIDLYEDTFENALKNKTKATNPAFIAVAARWAEFLTRKK